MIISTSHITQANEKLMGDHDKSFAHLEAKLQSSGINVNEIIAKLQAFQVAIPSWALGAGGTRFGRYSIGGEPSNIYDKLDDVGLIHALTNSAGAISLHIPWDVPDNVTKVKEAAAKWGLSFDAVNSNTFQDQDGQAFSYKFGSLCHVDKNVRKLAVAHNKEVIDIGRELGSKSLTVWLADGSSFPGQNNFRVSLSNTQDSLKEIYSHLPEDWLMYVEYKPYEPHFYSTVIQDWGTSLMLAENCGPKAHTLVDLGHHLPNTNIEQIVATLMMKGRLGGFHFNDSKYGDDDLTVGSIKPYQLFLIFNELVYGMENNTANNPNLAWMIDASHNLKDPIEDLIQSLEAILLAYAQALIVDRSVLTDAQMANDVTLCQEILQDAFRSDLRPLLKQARLMSGAAIHPLEVYRAVGVRQQLIAKRGSSSKATGL